MSAAAPPIIKMDTTIIIAPEEKETLDAKYNIGSSLFCYSVAKTCRGATKVLVVCLVSFVASKPSALN